MEKIDVKCPDCGYLYKTSKPDQTQCGTCGFRFPVKGNTIKV